MVKKSLPGLCLVFLLLSLKTSATSSHWESLVRFETCQEQLADEVLVEGSDFHWSQSLEELQARAQRLYAEGKRLPLRAFWNQETLVVPINTTQGQKLVRLTPQFIHSVRRHIEAGLARGYVDEVIFSDMGHSHLFIPNTFYREVLAPYAVADRDQMYEKMLAHPGIKVLYHTAEQLKMLDDDQVLSRDRHYQWRFYTRNLVGDNQALGRMELLHQRDHRYNTGRDYDPDYRYWGAGFYITANKDGCFPYSVKGETKYFDLNLEGIDFSGLKDYNQRLNDFIQESMPN